MLTIFVCSAGGARTALDKFPEYAARTGCREPDSVDQGPYQYAFDTPLNFFAYLQANNPLGTQFNNHMGGYRQGRPSWMDTDFFPVRERLVKGARNDPDAVLLVDVGGNVGHDLAEFRQKHGSAVGRVVLQDLPPVLGQIEALDASIERMPHDFFTEQPVKGRCIALRLNRKSSNNLDQVPARTTCTRFSMIGLTTPALASSRASEVPWCLDTASS